MGFHHYQITFIMLIPDSDQPHCYCISKDREATMLTCSKCKKLFHLGCLQSGSPSQLCGDIFFELTCAVCNDGEEFVSRMKMCWLQVVLLTLYNLHVTGVSGKCGYYRWKEHICSFIDKNWSTFFGVTKKKSGGWHGTVAGTLSSGCPIYFRSGASILNESGWWCLVDVKAPTLEVPVPKSKLSKQKRAESKDASAKGLRDRRNKTSIQAAMELKAKRDVTHEAKEIRKRSLSSSSESTPNTSSTFGTPATKLLKVKDEPAEYLADAEVKEEVDSESGACCTRATSELQKDGNASCTLFGDLMKSAGVDGGSTMSDDDFEVDPCSLSPSTSPLLYHQPDVQQLLASMDLDNLREIDDVMTPCDVTPADVSAASSTLGAMDTGSTNVSAAGMTSDSEPDVGDIDEEPVQEHSSDSETETNEQTPIKQIQYRSLSVYEERHLLRKLDILLESVTDDVKANRLRAKLRLRQLKRERGLPVFELDDCLRRYTNQQTPKCPGLATNVMNANRNTRSYRAGPEDRVLDRFQCAPSVRPVNTGEPVSFRQRLVGHDDSQLTCIISPYTTRQLKPFIRRDYETKPRRLRLLQEIIAYPHRHDKTWVAPLAPPIDYSYVRAQHIPSINQLCARFFWSGIDLSECLQYPDFSCVALYRRIVIGFAFMVPDVKYNEAYISFIFTHPDWRGAGIATYMIYHLIQTCLGKDITLHVSATNPAMVLYQKFGFKPEEFILDFYDKYYPYDSKECRHAFFLRLRR